MIQVLVPAKSRNLTTVATAKNVLGIEDDESDAVLSTLIAQASALIERYTGRSFALQTYRELLPGTDTPILILSNTPVVEAERVRCNGMEVTDWEIHDGEAGELYRSSLWDSGRVVCSGIGYFRATGVRKVWEVIYKAGYFLPGTKERNLPEDVEQACIAIVKELYVLRQASFRTSGEKVGEYSVSYSEKLDLGDLLSSLLQRWVRVV